MGVLAATFAGDDCVHGCLVAGQALAACFLVCQWFSPISYYNGILGYHLSSLPFCKIVCLFVCFKLQQKLRNYGKLGIVSIFLLSGIYSPMAYIPAPF